MRFQRRGHCLGEAHPVDGQRPAGRDLVLVGAGHDERSATPQLRMQQADRVGLGVVRAEGIGADEFGAAIRQVRLRAAHGPHLVQDDRHPGHRHVPGGFRAREPGADHVDRPDV